LQEYKEVTRSKSGDTGITLIPNEANLFLWRALLKVRGTTAAAGCMLLLPQQLLCWNM
jgi:hypothetical protein